MARKNLSRCQKVLQNTRNVLKKFCEKTSIHGLKYITEDGSHWTQRLTWVLAFAASIYFSAYFCQQMWNKWRDSPVLMSIDSNQYPLKNNPFPAVTICNVNKVSKKKLLGVLQEPKYKGVTNDVMKETLRYMIKLDRADGNENILVNFREIYRSMNITPTDLFEVLRRTAPSCQDMIIDCIWLGLPKPCYEYFTLLPTDDGMCCLFNSAQYYDPELHIKHNSTREPLRVNGNGHRKGLTLILDGNIEDYSVTSGTFNGFKVLVHHPEHFPDVADRGFVVGPGSETFAAIKGIRTFNTEEVARKVSLEQRKCQVKQDIHEKLKYFPHYSQSACIIECTTLLMQKRCHCRPYFYRADNGTRLCELDSYPCLSNVTEDIRQRDEELCHCLPPCTDTWYDAEISYATFPGYGFKLTRTFKRMVVARNLSVKSNSTEYMKSNFAVLHVFYKDKTGLLYKTDIRFGEEDFVSAMGGLLGLGLGISFISVFEIVYFFLLHWVFPYTSASYDKDPDDDQSTPLIKENDEE